MGDLRVASDTGLISTRTRILGVRRASIPRFRCVLICAVVHEHARPWIASSRSNTLLSADPDVSRHGLEAIWCTRAVWCTARLVAAGRRLAAPGRMLRVPSLWAGCGWGLWGGPAGGWPVPGSGLCVGRRSVCGWLRGGGEAGCCGVGLAVVPGQGIAGFPGRQARVWWHIWQRVTRRWVTVTGKRREPGLPITSCSASPAAVATPCPVLAAPLNGVRDTTAPSRGVCCGGIADGASGTTSARPVVPARDRRETVPPVSRFRARHPVLLLAIGLPGRGTRLGERSERLKAAPGTFHHAP